MVEVYVLRHVNGSFPIVVIWRLTVVKVHHVVMHGDVVPAPPNAGWQQNYGEQEFSSSIHER